MLESSSDFRTLHLQKYITQCSYVKRERNAGRSIMHTLTYIYIYIYK